MKIEKWRKIFQNKKVYVFTIIVVSIFFLYSRTESTETVVVRRENIQKILSAPGKIISEREVNLSFKTTGRISKLPFKDGDSVKTGEIIAQLDTREPVLALGRARDDLRQKEATLEKVYDDVKGHDNDESYAQRDARTVAEVARDKAVKNVLSAQEALRNASLVAPFDSTVVGVNVELNEWVSAFSLNEYDIKLADLSNIYFEVEVDQDSIADVRYGQDAIVRLDAYEGKQFSGKVFSVSKTVKRTLDGDNVVTVKILLSGFPDKLILGLEGDVEIVLLSKEGVLTIPKNAVIKEGRRKFVKVSGQRREVETGIFDGEKWEVLSGLNEGEKVSW